MKNKQEATVKDKLLDSPFYRKRHTLRQINHMSMFLSDKEDFRNKFFSSSSSNNCSSDDIPVKIVITEMSSSVTHRTWRRLVSQIASFTSVFPSFGMFHTSLIIGNQLYDWNSSSLCIPKSCVSEKAIFVSTITTFDKKEFEELIDPIIEYIIHCNTNLKYVNYGGDHETTLNCQDFVIQLLQQMNLKLQWQNDVPIQKFVKRLRKNGKCSIKKFENRSQLENYIQLCEMNNSQFVTGSDYRLLRAAADAMELKYSKYKERLVDCDNVIEKCDWEIKMLLNSRILNIQEQKELQKLQKTRSKAEKIKIRSKLMCQKYSSIAV